MTIAAIHLFPGVTDVDRMVIVNAAKRQAQLVLLELLREDRVAHVTVPGQDFPIVGDMFTVMTSKAARIVQMTNVIRELLPTHDHLREVIAAVDLLNLGDRLFDLCFLLDGNLRMIRRVEILDYATDAIECRLLRAILSFQRLDGDTLHTRETGINPAQGHYVID